MNEAFIFMKVGQHAGEEWGSILERKNREFRDAGMAFWGYGGTACHPLTQVQPFARRCVEQHGRIHLLMEPISSHADPDLLPATHFSRDGITWEHIPDGIRVTGSRYALVIGEIQPGELEIQAQDYVVGIGQSRGRSAADYLQGRVDKACLELSSSASVEVAPPKNGDRQVHHVQFRAELLDPYGVLLRHDE